MKDRYTMKNELRFKKWLLDLHQSHYGHSLYKEDGFHFYTTYDYSDNLPSFLYTHREFQTPWGKEWIRFKSHVSYWAVAFEQQGLLKSSDGVRFYLTNLGFQTIKLSKGDKFKVMCYNVYDSLVEFMRKMNLKSKVS